VLTLVILKDPGLVEQLQTGQAEQVVEGLRNDLPAAWSTPAPSPGDPTPPEDNSLPKPAAPGLGATAGWSNSADSTVGQSNPGTRDAPSTTWPAAPSFFPPTPTGPSGR
jgi:hypothetical protein